MDQYQKLKKELLDINQEISALLKQSESALGSSTAAFSQWRQTCKAIERHLMEHVIRTAVVGAIKSGKSTLVNALLQGDYLKRGAGVVTSIVTRIRRGDRISARLFFKSWDEINAEMEQALVLFPSGQWQSGNAHFDIRRSKDRIELEQALETLDAEMRISQDQLNAHGVLLSSYLKGYEQIQAYIGPDGSIQEFDAEQFSEHRAFVGNDALAVYLKDIQLEITGDVLTGNIELADCQGSDSPNPLHMAMIQDYLLKAHLTIYVISSRTGLRQADIRFLSMIKQMGIADNMLFVCNCDFDDHDDLNELQALVDRIKEEIGIIIPQPELFVFSALFNLYKACEADLTDRDRARLAQWRQAQELADYSNAESRRLETVLDRKLNQEKSALLLQNQLERMDVMSSGLQQWIRLNRDLLKRDAGDAQNAAERIRGHQGHILQVQSMIQSTLDGAVQKVKKEVRKQIDGFFDRHSGPVLQKVINHIRAYDVGLSDYQDQLAASGFTHTLYMVFQNFKQAVDAFMAEKINPEIIGFIGEEELRLKEYFRSVAEPYEAMIRNALSQYEETLAHFGLEALPEKWTVDLAPDIEGMKQAMGLSLPLAAAAMRYSAHIRTEAVMRLGLYSLVRVVRKALKKPLAGENTEELKALKHGVRRMKNETERSVIAHFKDYQENVKFQYMMRLADMAGVRLYEALTEHFRGYVTDLKDLVDTIGSEKEDKEKVDDALSAAEQTIDPIKNRIDTLRREVLRLGVNPNQKDPALTSSSAAGSI